MLSLFLVTNPLFKRYAFFLPIFFLLVIMRPELSAQKPVIDSINWWIDSTLHLSESQQKTYLEKAIVLAEENQLPYQRTRALFFLSKLITRQADYVKAFSLQDAVLRLSLDNQFDDLYNSALQQKGVIYTALEQYEKAKVSYEEALKLPYVQSRPLKIAETYNNLGTIAAISGNNTAALSYFQQAKVVFVAQGLENGVVKILNNMGVLYMQENRVPEALEIFQEQLIASQQQQDKQLEAQSYGNLAYAHYLLGQYTAALKAYDQSIAIAKKQGFNDVLAITYKDLTETYQTKGDFQKALETFQAYHDLHLKNVGEKTQKEVSALQVQYDLP